MLPRFLLGQANHAKEHNYLCRWCDSFNFILTDKRWFLACEEKKTCNKLVSQIYKYNFEQISSNSLCTN